MKVVKQISIDELRVRIYHPLSDSLYVVNLFATWCAPCVNEVPFFLQSTKKFENKKLKIIFVSLNFTSENYKIVDFIKKYKIENEVYQMNNQDPNEWMNKIDSTWSGAIPATIFYQSGRKIYFHEGELTQEKLDSIIHKSI